MFWLLIARLYAYWVWIMAKRFGLWLPGLGFLCRRITLEHIITYNDRKYVFLRRAASMYSTLLIGKPMEPETHAFLRRVIPQGPSPMGVVDVGAAIGEMVMEAAGFANVATVVAFDPDRESRRGCSGQRPRFNAQSFNMLEVLLVARYQHCLMRNRCCRD